MPKNLGTFIDLLRTTYPDQFRQVSRRIRPQNFEVTALLENLTIEQQYPVVFFLQPENTHGQVCDIQLVSNLFATRERCVIALDRSPEQSKMPLSLEFARRERLSVPPEFVTGYVPVQEVIQEGDAVDVGELPIVRHFEMDLGPVLTMICCMKDPDNGAYDMSFIKNFYRAKPDYMGVSVHSPHLERILGRYAEMNKPAPIITILGHHPAFSLSALALTGFERDDYETAGGFLGEPLRLAPSVTWGKDFLVPADAEIIIEGEIIPGAREVVDPFGEVTRHYQAQCLRQAMKVKAITRRRQAILQDVFSGHEEHWNLGSLPKEGSIFNTLRAKMGNVTAVHLPMSGVGRLSCYISIKKTTEGQAKQAALLALNEAPTMEVVVIVDHDIDVFRESNVIWAILTMSHPKRGITLIENFGKMVFTTEMGNSKLIIDATRPLHKPFPAMIKVPKDVLTEVRPEEWLDQEEER